MGCDMVVALKQATVQGNTLFGLNHHDVRPASLALCRFVGAHHAPDEVLRLGSLMLPQARRTCTVLGSQPRGTWGVTHGLNEHRVAAGFSCWQSKLPVVAAGLLGTDLVRLTLERSQSARQALDVLTDLVARHGQRGWGQPEQTDSIFLLADAKEAFVVETAGCHWAMLECQQVRAVSDAALIRQDWRRIAPGLAEFAISQGWWADDGSKLDVTGCLSAPASANSFPLKRWGKATLALEQQNGHIDSFFLRSLLGDHFDSTARRVANGEWRVASGECQAASEQGGYFTPLAPCTAPPLRLLTTFIAELPADAPTPPVAWCTYGPSAMPLFLPILLDGELPPKFAQQSAMESLFAKLDELLDLPEHMQSAREMLDKLQDQFDRQLEEFLGKARSLQGDATQVKRLAGLLMQSHWEMLEGETRRLASLEKKVLAVS